MAIIHESLSESRRDVAGLLVNPNFEHQLDLGFDAAPQDTPGKEA